MTSSSINLVKVLRCSRPVIQWMALSDGPTTSVTLPSLPSIAGGLSLPAGSYYWQLQSFLSENTSYDALGIAGLYNWRARSLLFSTIVIADPRRMKIKPSATQSAKLGCALRLRHSTFSPLNDFSLSHADITSAGVSRIPTPELPSKQLQGLSSKPSGRRSFVSKTSAELHEELIRGGTTIDS